MNRSPITAERIWYLLDYDDKTGLFAWRVTRGGRAKLGSPVGHTAKDGYVKVMIDGKTYGAHVLAWAYMTGALPVGEVDHLDGDRANNRFSNLRDVAHSVNTENRRQAHAGSATGVLGVTVHHDPRKPYRARIRVHGKIKSLGCFATLEAAADAYIAAKRRFHEGCTI